MSEQTLRLVEQSSLKTDLADFHIGDTVDVHTRILEGEKERIQIFNGVVIARAGSGSRETFTVRRIVAGEGVERKFPLHSPKVAKIEVKRSGVVRRAKLYFLRDRIGKAVRLRERRDDRETKRPRLQSRRPSKAEEGKSRNHLIMRVGLAPACDARTGSSQSSKLEQPSPLSQPGDWMRPSRQIVAQRLLGLVALLAPRAIAGRAGRTWPRPNICAASAITSSPAVIAPPSARSIWWRSTAARSCLSRSRRGSRTMPANRTRPSTRPNRPGFLGWPWPISSGTTCSTAAAVSTSSPSPGITIGQCPAGDRTLQACLRVDALTGGCLPSVGCTAHPPHPGRPQFGPSRLPRKLRCSIASSPSDV